MTDSAVKRNQVLLVKFVNTFFCRSFCFGLQVLKTFAGAKSLNSNHSLFPEPLVFDSLNPDC